MLKPGITWAILPWMLGRGKSFLKFVWIFLGFSKFGSFFADQNAEQKNYRRLGCPRSTSRSTAYTDLGQVTGD